MPSLVPCQAWALANPSDHPALLLHQAQGDQEELLGANKENGDDGGACPHDVSRCGVVHGQGWLTHFQGDG